MILRPFAVAATLALAAAAAPAFAQSTPIPTPSAMGPLGGNAMGSPMAPAMGDASMMAHGRLIEITIQNLTTGQGFSPAFFDSHAAGTTPLFALGEKAGEPLWNVAEGGNIGPFSNWAAGLVGTELGDAVVAVHNAPGGTRSVIIRVDEAHPQISGVWMLGMTNDGFAGFNDVDAYALTEPVTLDVMGFDAGSEKNSELKGYLGALGQGNMRDEENGVITVHTGIRGDADAPAAWKFDPALVARVTIGPVGAAAL